LAKTSLESRPVPLTRTILTHHFVPHDFLVAASPISKLWGLNFVIKEIKYKIQNVEGMRASHTHTKTLLQSLCAGANYQYQAELSCLLACKYLSSKLHTCSFLCSSSAACRKTWNPKPEVKPKYTIYQNVLLLILPAKKVQFSALVQMITILQANARTRARARTCTKCTHTHTRTEQSWDFSLLPLHHWVAQKKLQGQTYASPQRCPDRRLPLVHRHPRLLTDLNFGRGWKGCSHLLS